MTRHHDHWNATALRSFAVWQRANHPGWSIPLGPIGLQHAQLWVGDGQADLVLFRPRFATTGFNIHPLLHAVDHVMIVNDVFDNQPVWEQQKSAAIPAAWGLLNLDPRRKQVSLIRMPMSLRPIILRPLLRPLGRDALEDVLRSSGPPGLRWTASRRVVEDAICTTNLEETRPAVLANLLNPRFVWSPPIH